MRNFTWMLVGVLGACVAEPSDPGADPVTAEVAQDSFSYFPMGFARVTGAGGLATQFNSTSGSVTTSHTATGLYSVTFAGLGVGTGADASGGHVQITAEGATNVRCRISLWSGSPNVTASVRCNQPGGALADTPFAVMFFRYAMPAPTGWTTTAAYSYVQANGVVLSLYDYNNSGMHNTVTKTGPGSYTVNITGASYVNASMMVSTYGGLDPGAVCSVSTWGAGSASVRCHDSAGTLVDSAFSFSYSTSGPTSEQQGAHAWFDSTQANPMYSAALGKYACSAAGVTGSASGSLATMTVSGNLGSWDASPFLRASFVTDYSGFGQPGYCKAESLSSSGSAPSSIGTTTVRCYTPAGAAITGGRFTFTHVTSDASGPC